MRKQQINTGINLYRSTLAYLLLVEQVVFCKLADLQIQFYRHFLRSKTMTGLLSGQDAYALEVVNSLKKLINHPSLIWNAAHVCSFFKLHFFHHAGAKL